MYVCLCTGVTEKAIREVLREGASTVEEVMYCTGAGTRCGTCAAGIAELVLEHEAAEGDQAKSARRRLVVIRPVNSAA